MAAKGKLDGKVAIVTGGSGAIGSEICRSLASEGAFIVIADLVGNDELISEITAGGSKAIFVKTVVSQEADVVAAFDKTVEAFGGVHIVVPVAGISIAPMAALEDTTVEAWDKIFAVNSRGTFLVIREAAKRLGSGGRIITTSSGLGVSPIPRMGAYSATKAAVMSMTRTLALELAPKKITVNSIAPGPIATKLLYASSPVEMIEAMVKACPSGRLGEANDVAPVVQFLASEEARWVTGEVIGINGGGW